MRIIVAALLAGWVSVFAVSAAMAATGERIALVIGNANYEALSALSNPENDARDVAKTLEALQFEVVLAIDADRRGMARAIRDFGRQLTGAGTDAVGLFFYAGHGVQARNRNYLMPLHAQVIGEADLDIEAIDANWVLRQMEDAGNGLNIIILDACRNNPFRGSFRSADRGLARVNAPTGSIVAYSAAPGQVAADGDGRNSPYTAALIQAMQEPGVELSHVFRRVRNSVTAATGGDQTPWEEQSLTGDFFFVPDETDVAMIAPQPEQAPQSEQPATTPAQDDNDAELLFWNSVMDSSNPDELQAYLDVYPNGTFHGLAEIRIARLRAGVEEGEDVADDDPAAEPASTPPSEPADDGRTDTAEAEALLQQGEQYYYGEGVGQDQAEAARLFRSAAEQGLAEAQSWLGYLYHNGWGVAEDYGEAAKWFQLAAVQGDPFAQSTLGSMYEAGNGVDRDPVQAVRLYRMAAEQGQSFAQFALARSYQNGTGVAQDSVTSLVWLTASILNGHAESDTASMRLIVTAGLTAVEVSEAENLARQCIASNYQQCE